VPVKVLRIYHAGRDAAHRARERALVQAGAQVTLVVPQSWPGPGMQAQLSAEPFPMLQLPVSRAGDVNRHRYLDPAELARVVHEVAPDVVDVHEEPVSVAARQWLTAAGGRPVVMYTAQNIDKRFPPPFAQFEQAALRGVRGLYPCSRQAASVARGKGFGGLVRVLPLGLDDGVFAAGEQSLRDTVVELGLVGRMVPEKGCDDAVRVLAAVRARRPARLRLIGEGPALAGALELAQRLGVRDDVVLVPWCGAADLAKAYMGMHVVLVPSRATQTWVEQFGRVVLEAQACGAVVAGYASGAIPEVAAGAGVLVSEGDGAELALAVAELVSGSSGAFETLRSRGVANARATSWRAVAEQQVSLYSAVLAAAGGAAVAGGENSAPQMLQRRDLRAAAVAEFGAPARVHGQDRPFALPLLRTSGALSRGLGQVIDALAP
jgi:glycosyltransferase involved in cell wall biosynthesis